MNGGAISLGLHRIPETADLPAEDSGDYRSVASYQDRLEPQSLFKKNSFALNTCASAEEKIAQLGRVEVAIVLWVKAEKDFAARGEVTLQIAQEKIPFLRAPAFFRWMVKVEVDRKCRDPIKLLREIGQRLECADSAHDPGNCE